MRKEASVPTFTPKYPPGPVSREDFVDGENPTERGWSVLIHTFKSEQALKVLKALQESGNKPIPVRMFLPGFNHNHIRGINGVSAALHLYFKVILVHKRIPFEDNELKLVPKHC